VRALPRIPNVTRGLDPRIHHFSKIFPETDGLPNFKPGNDD
jgi:hypothetical protein